MTLTPELDAWRKARRADLTNRRAAIAAKDRAAWDATIAGHLRTLIAGERPGVIGFYWPMRGEFDARPLIEELLAGEWRAALPVVVGRDRPLEFRDWTPETEMVRGVLNIMVPREGAPVLPDVILAPLVGFDAAKYRLGNGGGYFDRTLAALDPPPTAVGVGYSLARLDTIQPQPHDRPMDAIVTELGILR